MRRPDQAALAIAAGLLLLAQAVLAQFPNVVVAGAQPLGMANEPCVALDPKRPQRVMVGTNLNLLARSIDGGKAWKRQQGRSRYGVYGDPVLVCDTAGDFWFLHLSNAPDGQWIDRIVCQKTPDMGLTWTVDTFVGLNPGKAQDKQWAVVDRSNNALHLSWTEFDQYDSPRPEHRSRIRYARSLDGGRSWSQPLVLSEREGDCLDGDMTAEGAVPALGPDSQVYVAWSLNDTIWFDRSDDGGATWLERDVAAAAQPGGWTYDVPGIYRCNGLPITLCDTTGGPFHGRIYINWTDQREGDDDTDVFVCHSDDQGRTWSSPRRVNHDLGASQQFFTWMAIDPATGWLYAVFHDRAPYAAGSVRTRASLAVSTDGGRDFRQYPLSERPFEPDASVFFGDYNGVVAQGGMARPVWTEMDGNLNQRVVMALVDSLPEPWLGPDNAPFAALCASRDPLPSVGRGEAFALVELDAPARLSLWVRDGFGRPLATPYLGLDFPPGSYFLPLRAETLGLPPGPYRWEARDDSGLPRASGMLRLP